MQELIKHLVEKNEDLTRENAELKDDIKTLTRQINKYLDFNQYLINELDELRDGKSCK